MENSQNSLLTMMEAKNSSYFNWFQDFSNHSRDKFEIQDRVLNKDDTHPIFQCTFINQKREKICSGKGRTKKEAKQNAAKDGLLKLLASNKKAIAYFNMRLGIIINDFDEIRTKIAQQYDSNYQYVNYIENLKQKNLISNVAWTENQIQGQSQIQITCKLDDQIEKCEGKNKKDTKNRCAYQILQKYVKSQLNIGDEEGITKKRKFNSIEEIQQLEKFYQKESQQQSNILNPKITNSNEQIQQTVEKVTEIQISARQIQQLTNTQKNASTSIQSTSQNEPKVEINEVQKININFGQNNSNLVKFEIQSNQENQENTINCFSNYLKIELIQFQYFDDIYTMKMTKILQQTQKFASSRSLNEIDYEFFEQFNFQMNIFLKNFKKNLEQKCLLIPLGSFTLRSIRVNRAEIDMILYIKQDQILQFQDTLIENSRTLHIKGFVTDSLKIEIIFDQRSSIFPNINLKSDELKAIIYLQEIIEDQDYPFQINHIVYMKQFSENLSANLYFNYGMILNRQWRDTAGLRNILPIEILDFLQIQITNKFTNTLHPFFQLRQIIYLLQENIIDEIINLKEKQYQINPFVVSITEFHYQVAQTLQEFSKAIQDIALQWNSNRIIEWLYSI